MPCVTEDPGDAAFTGGRRALHPAMTGSRPDGDYTGGRRPRQRRRAMAGEFASRMAGTGGRLFADPQPGPDETSFQVDNTSEQYYNSAYYRLHQSQLQPVPAPRVDPPRMQLADVLPEGTLTQIQSSGRITFHAVGDTGAAARRSIPNEAGVADAMSKDVAAGGPDAPAFLFHLGDVVYNFGEVEYYYDRFFEPFRAYDRPIFAVPGNHDGFPEFGIRRHAGGVPHQLLRRPTRTVSRRRRSGADHDDPAGRVLHARCAVRLDHRPVHQRPGGAGGHLHAGRGLHRPDERRPVELPDLRAQAPRGGSRPSGQPARRDRRLPPPSGVRRRDYGGSTGLSADIDRACGEAGIWPDAVLSGHAHLYQRFTRSMGTLQIPYVVSGSGGFGLTPPRSRYPSGSAGGYTLAAGPFLEYGYLVVTVDVTGSPLLTISFRPTSGSGDKDSVTVDLTRHSM